MEDKLESKDRTEEKMKEKELDSSNDDLFL
jgi:hypothetical protein